ncbi:MAG TPA: ATP-binding protein [Burkholderiales bacterium]|nr:ATP-binding protein [Burkholderiales bacterium]
MTVRPFALRRGLGAYLAVVFSALTILATFVLTQVIGVTASTEIKRNIAEDLAALAALATTRLDRSMFERYREVQITAERNTFGDEVNAADVQRKTFESMQDTHFYYTWIGLADLNGKVRVATRGMLEGSDVSQEPWFRSALAGVHVLDLHEVRPLAELLPNPGDKPLRFVAVAFPHLNRNGKTIGVLGVLLSWDGAEEVARSILDRLEAGRQIELFILDRDGKVLLGPEDMVGQIIEAPSFKAAQVRPNGSTVERWNDGHDYVVGYSASRGYHSYRGVGWTVLVRQELNNAYAPVAHLQRNVLWSGVAIALPFSVLAFFVARRITRPLRALAESAARIEKGETIEVAINDKAYFEVRALSRSLNSLVANLLQKESSLRELNQSLEQRIEARTHDLEQALAEVRASEARIQSILDTAQNSFVGMDLEGRITDWNDRAEEVFGWRKADVIGRSVEETILPQRFHADFRAALRDFHPDNAFWLTQRLERVAVNGQGVEFPVEVSMGLAGVSGSSFFGMFIYDISERKEMERMKAAFISTVSHELRTPITAIRLSLGLLATEAVSLAPEMRQLLQAANESCDRLVRLVNDILDIQKIEAGGVQYTMREQPLRPILQQALEAMQAYATKFGVQLQLADGPEQLLKVDSDRIVQVAINLLSNAIKFSPKGGEVRVELEATENGARFSVRDNGPGIPEIFWPRVFEKFAQADSTDSRQKGGTGLGLAICKELVEAHGGRISFESEPGRTVFHVWLRRAGSDT